MRYAFVFVAFCLAQLILLWQALAYAPVAEEPPVINVGVPVPYCLPEGNLPLRTFPLEFCISNRVSIVEYSSADYSTYKLFGPGRQESLLINSGPFWGMDARTTTMESGINVNTRREFDCVGFDGYDMVSVRPDSKKSRRLVILGVDASYSLVSPDSADIFDRILDSRRCIEYPVFASTSHQH